jgi:hypothetical protein
MLKSARGTRCERCGKQSTESPIAGYLGDVAVGESAPTLYTSPLLYTENSEGDVKICRKCMNVFNHVLAKYIEVMSKSSKFDVKAIVHFNREFLKSKGSMHFIYLI